MAGLCARVILLLATLALSAEPSAFAVEPGDAALVNDDECAAGAVGVDGACGLQALQLRAKRQQAEDAGGQAGEWPNPFHGSDKDTQHTQAVESDAINCYPEAGQLAPWCGTLRNFSALFDTNDPAKMQQAVDHFCSFASNEEGITVALTERSYYLMYHQNVERVLKQYLSTGLFHWRMGNNITEIDKHKENTVRLVRDGTFTLELGWRKSLFTSVLMRTLPNAVKFPFSHVKTLEDCKECPAKFVFTVKNIASTDTEHHWVITELILVKLAPGV